MTDEVYGERHTPTRSGAKRRGAFRTITTKTLPVVMRLWDTPVPIPNTMVKTQTADGTILETVWESRRLPGPFLKRTGGHGRGRTCTLKTAYSKVFYLYLRIQVKTTSKLDFLAKNNQ